MRKQAFDFLNYLEKRTRIDFPYFARNGFWVILNQSVTLLSGLVLSIVYARYFLKEVFGAYQFVIAVLSIVSVSSLPGLNTSLALSVAKGMHGNYKQVVRLSFVWSLIGIPLLILTALYFLMDLQKDLFISIALSSLFFPLLYAPNTWNSFLQGKSNFDLLAKWNVIQTIVCTIVFSGISIIIPKSILGIVSAYLLFNSFFNIYFYKKSLKLIENENRDAETISFGKFITKLQIVGLIVNHFDKLIVGLFDIKVLAIYMIAIKIFDVIKGFIKSVFSVTFPKFAKKRIRISLMQQGFVFLAGLLCSFIIYLFADFIIELLFTNKFADSALFLKKLVWVIPFITTYFFLVQKVSAQKNTKKMTQLQLIPSLIAILFSVILLLVSGDVEIFVLSKIYLLYIISFLVVIKS